MDKTGMIEKKACIFRSLVVVYIYTHQSNALLLPLIQLERHILKPSIGSGGR